MAAAILSPRFKVCSYATEAEKKHFQSEGENYIKDLWNKVNKLEEKKSETPQSTGSASSFFGKDYDAEIHPTSSIDNELILLRLDSTNIELKKFWLIRKSNYPCLFKVFRYLMCLPATSVPSERLFSSCSDQIWAKRNRLSAESFEKIMFIYKNLRSNN